MQPEMHSDCQKTASHDSLRIDDPSTGEYGVFDDKGIWYDAIGAYAQLINRFPERPEVYDERGQIYLQLKPTRPLAEKDFKTADGLRAKR